MSLLHRQACTGSTIFRNFGRGLDVQNPVHRDWVKGCCQVQSGGEAQVDLACSVQPSSWYSLHIPPSLPSPSCVSTVLICCTSSVQRNGQCSTSQVGACLRTQGLSRPVSVSSSIDVFAMLHMFQFCSDNVLSGCICRSTYQGKSTTQLTGVCARPDWLARADALAAWLCCCWACLPRQLG